MYLHTQIIYCNYFHFLSNEFYVHYAVCYNRKVALNSILNYKKTLLVVLCSKLLQNLASKDAGILFLIRFLCCHYPKIWKMTFRQPCLQCNIMLRERERNFTYYANSYFLEENAFKSQFMTNAIYFPGFPSHFIKEFRSKCRHKSQRNPPPSKNFDFRQIA